MMKRDRQGEKRPVFSFGQIMIPLVGLIAIGLLYLGVKMFFFTPTRIVNDKANIPPAEIEAQPAPISNHADTGPAKPASKAPGTSAKATPSVPIEEPLASSKNVVAVPSSESSAAKSTKAASKTTTDGLEAKTSQQPSATSQPSKGGWGVQVGSFTEKWRADEVKGKLEKAGYGNQVRIVEAVVNGKRYYRVQVYAGGDVSDAKQLEKKMQDMNLPTFVVKY
ncbi:hypothetical protein Anamo_0874 [Acetomicrobium mobile DSM 13181]|uniref:SPOR domain-containing protein n=2 Tax=Acetomicrobium TaxID=49894 RepID=I4BW54_ACEMN|nr:SPOR domain-containing protein [Acetomicrobium mobile]AFM21511.1 hypothetical protein Anamo_0874 [Acetomicrobium mobile DSM 13181]